MKATSASSPLVVGLIGAIGAGKSTVARRLAERGAAVLPGDEAGHEVLQRPEIIAEVIRHFGPEVVDTHGAIDRRRLGAIVFAESARLHQLETIVHPAIGALLRERANAARCVPGTPMVVVDAAVMLEAQWDGFCDRILFVDAPRDQRLERVRQQRGWSDEELTRREKAQWPLDEKRARADVVLRNDGDLARCHEQVDRLFTLWTAPADCPAEYETRMHHANV